MSLPRLDGHLRKVGPTSTGNEGWRRGSGAERARAGARSSQLSQPPIFPEAALRRPPRALRFGGRATAAGTFRGRPGPRFTVGAGSRAVAGGSASTGGRAAAGSAGTGPAAAALGGNDAPPPSPPPRRGAGGQARLLRPARGPAGQP